MIDRQIEKQLFRLVSWFTAAWILLLMLSSCNPYEGLAAPSVTVETPTRSRPTQSPTASPTSTKPSADLCTVRTGVPRGYLNLRTGAGTRYAVIRILAEGEVLEVLERAAWLQVIDRKGKQGYVYRRYCQ